MTLFKDVSM